MPSIASGGSSVFGRLTGKRQPNEIASTTSIGSGGERSQTSPPLNIFSDSDPRSKLLNGHKRDSSILSLPSSVTDLGHNVRRSVSLRSHRTNPSQSSLGHRPRYPSSGNLLATPPLLSPTEGPERAQSQLPQPPRSRNKLSISARSISSRFKSTDTLPIITASDEQNGTADRPPVPETDFSMLVAPSAPKRAPPDRPALATQSSFIRETPSSHGLANGAPSISTANTVTAGSHNPSIIYQTIRETAAKRMATIDYMRKVHDGNVFYFSTLHYTPSGLSAMPSLMQHKLGRRATNYLVLGYSLPALTDLNSGSPLEFLKAISALLQEFETYQSLSGYDSSGSSLSRARVGQMFKTGMGLGNRAGKGRRSSANTDSIALDTQRANGLGIPTSGSDASSPSDLPSPMNPSGHVFDHLMTPHLPFEPDFNTTFATLCDTLIDTYSKLLELVSSPELCSSGVGDAFAKADKAVRKILVSNIMREFEDSTRAGVKGEVAGLARLTLGGLM